MNDSPSMTPAASLPAPPPSPWAQLIKQMGVPAALLSAEGVVLHASQQLGELLGAPMELIEGTPLIRFIFAGQHESFVTQFAQARNGPCTSEMIGLRADNRRLPLLLTFCPMPPESGGTIGVVVADQTLHYQVEQLQRRQAELEQTLAEQSTAATRANETLANSRLAALNVLEDAMQAREQAEQASAALRQSEARLRLHFQHMPAACAVTNASLVVEDWNPACELIFGHTREQALNRSLPALVFRPEAESQGRTLFTAAQTRRHARYSVEENLTADGRTIVCEWQVVGLFDTAGTFTGCLAMALDITGRKQAELALRESEERFRTLVETAPEPILVQIDGICAYVNQAALHLYGATHLRQLVGRPALERVAPEFRELVASRFRSVNENRRSTEKVETIHLRLDGTPIQVEASSVPFVFQGAAGGLTFVRDVSARKHAEQALIRQLHFQQQLLDAIPAPVFYKDIDGKHLGCNLAFCEFLGRPPEEVIGQKFEELFALTGVDEVVWRDPELLGAGEQQVYERVITRHDGSQRQVQFHKAAYSGTDRAIAGTVGIILDITDIKQANQALRESERRFRSLFDSTNEAVALHELVCDENRQPVDYRILDCNPAFTAQTGIPRETALGRLGSLVYGTGAAPYLEEYSAVARGAPPTHFESYFAPLDRYFHVAVFSPAPGYFATTALDITQQKQSESALRESEERFKAIANYTVDWESWLGPNGEIRWINPGALRVTGYSAEECAAMPDYPLPIVHPQDHSRMREALDLARRGIRGDDYIFRMVRKDGETRWASISWQPIFDTHGQSLGFRSSARDITDRMRTEAALRTSEERLTLALEGAGQAIWEHNILTGASTVSDQFCRMLGYGPGAIPAELSAWRDLLHPDDLASIAGELKRQLSEHPAHMLFEVRFRTNTGDYRWVQSRARVTELDPAGHPLRVVGVSFDVTSRKLADERVRELNVELEQRVAQRTAQLETINKELETFTYSVSHDLKAPLRGIDGYSQIVLRDYASKLDEDGRQCLQNIRSATQHMNELINDLLAYSRLERRRLTPRELDPAALIQTLVTEQQAVIQQHGVQISIQIAPVRLKVDADGLAAALRNLIDNAIKFTAHRADPVIEIRGEIAGDHYRLTVRDNGPGFDMKYHDRIFEIFQRLHRAEDYPGTGIGLAIVRKAMDRLDGRAWAESTPGQGATFHLELPL
jgi:PAS domain S-box-containing protein